jgi:hypothetical protein
LTVAGRIRLARTEEQLEGRWKDAVAAGQVAGGYWGVLSHPICSDELQWRYFGEIHMLSHLVGSSRQSDLSRVHDLDVTCTSLEGKLAQLKHDHRAVLKERKGLEDELVEQRRGLERSERRLVRVQERISELESQSGATAIGARVDGLERDLRQAQQKANDVETKLFETQHLLDDALATATRVAKEMGELVAENQAMEIELAASILEQVERIGDETREEPGLSGKRVLCVGGRASLVQYYRAVVERRGGEFLHHDGGLEDSMDAVTRALSTVDAVVCPVDCVSHAACLRVKKACKHLAKQFIVLRSSGLSSFARGIQTIAACG